MLLPPMSARTRTFVSRTALGGAGRPGTPHLAYGLVYRTIDLAFTPRRRLLSHPLRHEEELHLRRQHFLEQPGPLLRRQRFDAILEAIDLGPATSHSVFLSPQA